MTQDNKGNAFRMFLIEDLAWREEEMGKDVIRLTLGKTDLPLQKSIREKMKKSLDDFEKSGLVFPIGLPELRDAISAHYKLEIGLDVGSDKVFIDSGTSSIFRNLLQIICEGQDEVLIPRPYYPLYKISAQLAKAQIKYYNIDTDKMDIDIDTLEQKITKNTKAIILNSPGNPLGNIISREILLKISELLAEWVCIKFG